MSGHLQNIIKKDFIHLCNAIQQNQKESMNDFKEKLIESFCNLDALTDVFINELRTLIFNKKEVIIYMSDTYDSTKYFF